MGIATPPPSFPSILSHSRTNQQHHSFSSTFDKPDDTSSNSMSQDYHQGIFAFSNGFERSTAVTQQEQHHLAAQQIRRDKVRVQGFDPQLPQPQSQLPPPTLVGVDEEESGGIPVYETAGMLSEMFNFPPAGGGGGGGAVASAELLEQPMTATFRSSATRPVASTTMGSDWYGNRQGVLTALGPLGGESKNHNSNNNNNHHHQHQHGSVNSRDSSVMVHHHHHHDHNQQQPHHHHHHHQMSSINADSAAAMQLFLMNPQTRSPSPPSSHHTTTTPPPTTTPNSSTLHMLLPNSTSLQGFPGSTGSGATGGSFGHFTWVPDNTTNNNHNHNNNNNHPGEIGGVVEGQGLSLSLSSSLQHLEAAKAEELRMGESGFLYYNQESGGPSSYPNYKNIGGGHPHHHHHQQAMHMQGALGQNHIGFASSSSSASSSLGVVNVLRNSKYAKATQELLEEFCSVGRGQFKKNKLSRQLSNPSSNQGGGASSSSSKDLPPLSASDRIEHQRRKVKLLTMLDEVDRRYSHYCEQMHMVVNSFDLVMGYGAAVPYTALAQKAMSRHFRCLKDAITAQLKHSCELLGEKDGAGSSGLTKGETPRLRLLEQSLRQQRAFHQMGMMEQEAWRPQRGLPERSVNILRAWLFEHFLHPYPSDADKHLLARQTGLSRNQVSNWFINARVRLWKPMVEDMYQQEVKDADGADADEDDNNEEIRNHQSNNNNNSVHQAQTPTPSSTTPPTTTSTTAAPPQPTSTTTPTTESDPPLAAINRQGFLENQANSSTTITTTSMVAPPPVVVVSQCLDSLSSDLPPHNNNNNVSMATDDTCRHGGLLSSADYGTAPPPPSSAATSDIASSTLIRFGTNTPGDVSLTLGLRHAGNMPDKTPFSVRDFGGI